MPLPKRTDAILIVLLYNKSVMLYVVFLRKGDFMLYRQFGNTPEQISILGFGCMRFPYLNDDVRQIDEVKATEMLHYAIDQGVNYIDTAYPYHRKMSEPFVGRALRGGYRERVYLATKLPSWLIKSREDMDLYLDEQLKNLQTDYIDFYLVHALNKDYWSNLVSLGIFEFLDQILKDGRVKYVGFSFHDELPLFKEIVDAYPWTFCQIQYNILDTHYQAGQEGLAYAHEKGLATIIMEPLRGGFLTHTLPHEVADKWSMTDGAKSAAHVCLKYLWNDPRINLVLSGMSDLGQLADNLLYASDASPNCLSDNDMQLIQEVQEIYHSKIAVNCTGCEYCLPCPHGVNIPECFARYNDSKMFGDLSRSKSQYFQFLEEKSRASQCTACGLCESKCPQHISIREKLREVVSTFE